MNQTMQSPEGRWHEWTRGDRLRIARESVTQSQGEFAELTGISRGTVSRYENNVPAKELYVKQWALATGYSYRWLMFGEIPNADTPDTGPVSGWKLPEAQVIHLAVA